MIRNIRKNQAFTLVEIMIAIGVVILLFGLSIHGLVRAKVTANETAAIRSLKTLHSAFTSYRTMNIRYPQTFVELVQAQPPYIDNKWTQTGRSTESSASERQGYRFTVVETENNTFQLAAVPISEGVTGVRSFYIDESGTIIASEEGKIPGGTCGREGCTEGGATVSPE